MKATPDIRKISLFSLLVSFFFCALPASAGPKTLLIGIDGVQYERMMVLNLPNIKTLRIEPSYTGGIAGSSTRQATVSGPGWATVLTGVWANKHFIIGNNTDPANSGYPSLFKRIRQSLPQAYISSVVSWPDITQYYFKEDVKDNDVDQRLSSDEAVISSAVNILRNHPADFTFVQLSEPDLVGHDKCFGSQYNESLYRADRHVRDLLAAVAARNKAEEDWLVLITTDHGRTPGNGCHHGNQTKEEKTTFIASNKSMNPEFSNRLTGLENMDFSGIYGTAAQTSITPTILRHMGIVLKSEWLLDGNPLINELSVRKPMISALGRLRWHAGSGGVVSIYRDGTLVGEVPTIENGWNDPHGSAGAEYSMVTNNTPVALSGINSVSAALEWTYPISYYFFKDGRYMRYDNRRDMADLPYPAPIFENAWRGVSAYANKVVGGVSRDGTIAYIFLNDGRYIRFNKKLDRADQGFPQLINDINWSGMGVYAKNILTAVSWKENKMMFILKDGRYVVFDYPSDRVVPGYPKPINNNTWPGVGDHVSDIVSMVKFDANIIFIFLKGNRYIKYNIAADRAEAGYPLPVNNNTWPGLL